MSEAAHRRPRHGVAERGVAGVAGGLSSARGRREREGKRERKRKERKEKRKWKRKRQKNEKEKGKEGERREIVRVPAKSAAAAAGWSSTRALSGDTQRVARSEKKKMGHRVFGTGKSFRNLGFRALGGS